ncbi:MAG: 2-amino-4-hydroxy-6-hydroxymethyldihydropteridine diphosphokinase [Bacteroidales bacterium]
MGKVVFLGLGTNLGDRETILNEAIEHLIKSAGDVISLSAIYETEPWGFQSENKFLNMVVGLRTMLNPDALLKRVMNIEAKLGRIRTGEGYSSRTIDIDILLYNDLVINKPDLKIPHPLIRERRFVLVPLCDVAPDLVHPVFKKTIASLLKECKDDIQVKWFK